MAYEEDSTQEVLTDAITADVMDESARSDGS